MALVDVALRTGPPGPYAVQAAIAALYGVLDGMARSPVVALNRAVAVAMAEGPGAALPLLDRIEEGGELAGHHLLHAARADLLARLGRTDEARTSYERAITAAGNGPERRLLERKRHGLR